MLAHDGTAALVHIRKRNRRFAGTVQHRFLRGFRQLLERFIEVEIVERGQVRQHLEIELVAAIPAFDGAGRQRQIRERDDALRIEKLDVAQAIALLAGTHRVVEREQARLEFLQRVAADITSKLVRVDVFFLAVHLEHHGAAVGQAQRRFETFSQTLLDVARHLDAVDHHVDRVLFRFLSFGRSSTS